jgi:6-pyruvoyltetrahydropterin/6-carboxytetrahydropterin synthase
MILTVTRHHDFCCGHRVVGHEGKCRHLHGHNYRAYFTCHASALDSVGRVIDFSVIKEKACEWLETNWDHRFLMWEDDPLLRPMLSAVVPAYASETRLSDTGGAADIGAGIRVIKFNPTAENMAAHLLHTLTDPFAELGVALLSVRLDETRKCSAKARW